jgi:hypothetical protein
MCFLGSSDFGTKVSAVTVNFKGDFFSRGGRLSFFSRGGRVSFFSSGGSVGFSIGEGETGFNFSIGGNDDFGGDTSFGVSPLLRGGNEILILVRGGSFDIFKILDLFD